MSERRYGLAAPGVLRRNPQLPAFLPEVDRWVASARHADVLLSTPDPASLAWSQRLGLSGAAQLVVEDGLVRSVGDAGTGAPSLSVVVQDAAQRLRSAPCAFQGFLDDSTPLTPGLLDEAGDLLAFKHAEGLARTNSAMPAPALCAAGRPRILIVDRAPGDEFLGTPRAPAAAFEAMFHSARAEAPGAFVIVLRFKGCEGLSCATLANANAVLQDVDIVDLVGRVDAVHTVSSLAGLEAILAGTPVTCHGVPFYAGVGLTTDRQATPRRPVLSREALFAVAYLLLPRYIDPLTGTACTPRLAFERLAAFKRHARRVAGDWRPVNIRPFKQGVMKAFLSSPCSHYPARSGATPRLALWATSDDVSRPGQNDEPALTRIEDGFVRSVGLGSSFTPAGSLVLDNGGIHFDPRQSSDLERLMLETDFDAALLARAVRLRQMIVEGGLTKYNLPGPAPPRIEASPGRAVVFVPGQVEDDAAVRLGGRGMTNFRLLERVRAARPEAHIVFKEHPDVTAGNRTGGVPDSLALGLADQVLRHADVLACIEAADEVHTLTSLAGFEALLRGKPVTTHGWPFYAGWGLTTDAEPWPGSPREPRSLDALVAAALILYPLYLDPVTALPCDAVTFVERLRELRDRSPGRRPRGRILRLIQAALVMLHPPQARTY